jgi:hypothetical protein
MVSYCKDFSHLSSCTQRDPEVASNRICYFKLSNGRRRIRTLKLEQEPVNHKQAFDERAAPLFPAPSNSWFPQKVHNCSRNSQLHDGVQCLWKCSHRCRKQCSLNSPLPTTPPSSGRGRRSTSTMSSALSTCVFYRLELTLSVRRVVLSRPIPPLWYDIVNCILQSALLALSSAHAHTVSYRLFTFDACSPHL